MADRYAPSHTEEPVRAKKRGKTPAWRLIIQDILLTGLVLCIFALFHHVIPRMGIAKAEPPKPTSAALAPSESPAAAAAPENSPEPTEEVVDNRTEWQKKFADHFTDEIVSAENSYTSPDVSINISTVTVGEGAYSSQCHIADIYIGQIENFQTYFATGSYGYYAEQSALGIDEDSGALIAINGDYCNNQTSGFLVRNGELYFSEQTSNDICVLYKDGTMATYAPDEYVVEDELQKNVYQVWKFGPKLLDADGVSMTTFNTSSPIKWENPRSAIGYYEPGHYCFVVVDGRQDGYSRGLKIEELAKLFANLGCKAAYNLDGGASAVMTFNDAIYSRPSNGGRALGDALLIKELDGIGEGEAK